MESVLSWTWSSIPQPPSNEPDGVMVFPTRKTANARRDTTSTAAIAAYDGNCTDGAAVLAVPLSGGETSKDADLVSDDSVNKEPIHLEGSDMLQNYFHV